ncbi:MAG: SWIM zinc finger containing protein, partial [Haloquadratum sp. J07HQX50]
MFVFEPTLESESSSDTESKTEDSTEIEPRLRRALEEPLSVVSTEGTPVESDAWFVSVVSHSGESYTVDVRDGRCNCPDAQYHLSDDQQCKHQLRAKIALGQMSVPPHALESVDVDRLLGEHTDAKLQFLANDGGYYRRRTPL